GLDDARRMTQVGSDDLGCRAEQVLVCSTGGIGRPLPMLEVERGICAASRALEVGEAALDRAAHAILTADTQIKVSTQAIRIGDAEIRVTGFAKGAAMIGPNLATLLAFVLTDAAARPEDLAAIAKRIADATFNCISVEGHTSTNDTLLFLANG